MCNLKVLVHLKKTQYLIIIKYETIRRRRYYASLLLNFRYTIINDVKLTDYLSKDFLVMLAPNCFTTVFIYLLIYCF